jgi:hypothetical protein
MEEILGRGRIGLSLICIQKIQQETIYLYRIRGMSEKILSIAEV